MGEDKPPRQKSQRALQAETIHKLLRRGCTVTVTYASGVQHTFKPKGKDNG